MVEIFSPFHQLGRRFIDLGVSVLSERARLDFELPSLRLVLDLESVDDLALPFGDPEFSHRHLKLQLNPYTDQGSRRPKLRRVCMEWIRQHLLSEKPLHVLHPLCGPGLIAKELDDWDIARYVGLDISPANIEFARNELSDSRFLFRRADLRDDGFIEDGECFGLFLLSYEAANTFEPRTLTRILSRFSEASEPGAFIAGEFRTVDQTCWTRREGRTYSMFTAASVFHDRPHLLLDEWTLSTHGQRFGHRLIVIEMKQPIQITEIFHSSIWIYGRDEFLSLARDAGFRLVAAAHPLANCTTDVLEMKGDTSFVLQRR